MKHSIDRPVCCECASVWLCKCVLRVFLYFTIKSKRTGGGSVQIGIQTLSTKHRFHAKAIVTAFVV